MGERAAVIIAFIVYLQIYDHATSVPLPKHLQPYRVYSPIPLWSALNLFRLLLLQPLRSVHFTLCQIANLTGTR